MRVFQIFIALCFICGCVSRTIPDNRFHESNLLASPGNITPANETQFTFAVVGDLHIGGGDTTLFRKILAAANNNGDEFIVLLGDLVDQGVLSDMQAIQTALSDTGWNNKAYFIVGNHDIFEGGWTHYKDTFGPSHYTFTAGSATFIALDTADGSVGDHQLAWFKAALAASQTTHLFVLSHYLPTISGIRTYLKFANEVEAMQVMKLSTDNQVTAWLGGHYHSFISGAAADVAYVVAGGGGGRRMDPVQQNFYVQVVINGEAVSYQLKTVE